MKKTFLYPIILAAGLLAATAIAAWPRAQHVPASSPAAYAPTPENIARGEYLARAGDCMACHTARAGAPFAGGRFLDTPFGRVAAPNITPDTATGIGNWSADDFWGALHNGTSKDGRLLYPAFPYANYTKITRADSDALYAYLRSVAPVRQASPAHALRFPYNQQWALAGWRLLYFKPGVYEPDTRQDASWNRGAYLVQGLGHCNACHSSRNSLGASEQGLSGGLIPQLGWYAPSLTADSEAGLGNWEVEHIVQLLRTGVSPRATVFGPMAEVVARSLQHLSSDDARAMALYLKSLPASPATPAAEAPAGAEAERTIQAGKVLYEHHCADCHGADGRGKAPAYPPLAGNRALTMREPVNAIRVVLNGGFAPGTAGNPRPYGMPPFGPVLGDAEVAQVVTYLRASWGNRASAVTAQDVNRYRTVPLD
ncbi:cytochrome c [Massilia solisilvae]|uniref:Cytochrome c n=1 Tax=Massilia solisilvae TaxID=1811225 RepID=A0ABT2BKB6_9BURK|nr:cytochrome c [Massilia solisilvae]MCS0608952.1 cytochrome c [Massilia solisilvae]